MTLVYKDFDSETVSNTTTQTNIFNFDFEEFQRLNGGQNLGLFGPNQAVEVTLYGLFTQAVGGTPQVTFKSYFDSRALGDFVVDVPSGYPYFKLVYKIFARSGKNNVYVIREFYTGDGAPNLDDSRVGITSVPNATDLVAENNFKVDVVLSTASANLAINKQIATVEWL